MKQENWDKGWQKNSHYLIRILQREVGQAELDNELSKKIKELPKLVSELTTAIKSNDKKAVEVLVLKITDISPELAPYLDELVADELLNSNVLDFTRVLAQPTIFAKAA